jgi:uncharacterized protein
MNLAAVLQLADWRRQTAALYARVREHLDPAAADALWREGRDRMMRSHPQSRLPAADPIRARGGPYGPYDPALRWIARVEPVSRPHVTRALGMSAFWSGDFTEAEKAFAGTVSAGESVGYYAAQIYALGYLAVISAERAERAEAGAPDVRASRDALTTHLGSWPPGGKMQIVKLPGRLDGRGHVCAVAPAGRERSWAHR